jgi:predicted nucleic acid-binding protein
VIFVDSSHWIAELLPRDSRHRQAMDVARAVASRRLLTSNVVLAETWTYLRRRAGHALAVRWLDGVISETSVRIERIDHNLEDEAWAWLRLHDERPYSFVDATSFALMRRMRITDALAFDGDFAAAGFNELRP